MLLACDRDGSPPRDRAVDTLMRGEPPTPVAPAAPSRPVPQLRFEDYAVADTSLGRQRPAAPRLAGAPYGRMYRTMVRDGAARGPNFAGHFTIVVWGCGTGCGIVAVADARTGRLSRQTLLTANGVHYRRDSRLLLADPRTPETPPDCASCGTPAYYQWRGGRFEPVGPGPHPHLRGPRPWTNECVPEDTAAGATTGLYACPK
jgi:hypothetical protein